MDAERPSDRPETTPGGVEQRSRPLDINKLRMKEENYYQRESQMYSTSVPQGNAPSRPCESQRVSFEATPQIKELKEVSPTSVVRYTHYQNVQLRLQFKALVVNLASVNSKSSPYPSRAPMKIPPPPDIKSLGDYRIQRSLGSGSTAKVVMAVHGATKEQVAIKCIVRQRPGMDPPKNSKESVVLRERRIYREASILYLLKHPNIVGMKDFFVCDEYFCMIFEYVPGVQLLDYITANGKLKEKAARKFMRQMVSAVDYCHLNSIAHRDLKIENMLVDLNSNIKILDFGLSNYYNPDELLKTFCGSLYFAAPELLMGKAYMGPEVDVWALGVVLYVMVCGKVPFDDKSLPALHEKIKRCEISYPYHVSPECKSLLERMICPDGKKRATLSEVIEHPWLNQGYDLTVRSFTNDRVPLSFVDADIKRFMENEFKTQYSPQQIRTVLDAACSDWEKVKNHPLISLYYLIRDKMAQDGILIPQAQKPLGIRSPSCPDLIPPPGLTQKQDVSDARRTRNLPVAVSSSSTVESPALPPLSRTRRASMSIPVSPGPSCYNRSLEDSDIKTVYLKGLFSTSSTTKKTPNELRGIIADLLKKDAIAFENRGAVFVCEYTPSVSPSEMSVEPSAGLNPSTEQISKITFEIHIVKVAVFGQYGVLFKRLQGNISVYKSLCSQILTQLDL